MDRSKNTAASVRSDSVEFRLEDLEARQIGFELGTVAALEVLVSRVAFLEEERRRLQLRPWDGVVKSPSGKVLAVFPF